MKLVNLNNPDNSVKGKKGITAKMHKVKGILVAMFNLSNPNITGMRRARQCNAIAGETA